MIAVPSRPTSGVISLALATGLMLSPESLIILGNSVGIVGISFLVCIISAMVVHLFTALSYGEVHALYPGPGGEARVMKETLGSIPAIVFPLCSRVVFVICAATGILATAGYAFNEIFVSWFPNLGFSFCLLGFLLVLNLWDQRVSKMVQVIFVAVALFGLIFLSAVGLMEGGKPLQVAEAAGHLSFNITRVVLLGLILFIGFDLAGLAKGSEEKSSSHLVGSTMAGIVLVGFVFILWGLVSLQYVSPERLSDTTVPYSIAARAILGENGRIVMGVVVLAGTCSAVNALLIAVSRMIAGMASHGLLPSFFGLAGDRAPVPLIILASGIAAMLALGMAGASVLEVYTRAGLLFWLLNYAAVQLSILIMRRRSCGRSTLSRIPGYPAVTVISLLVMCLGFAGLLWSDRESVLVFKFMLIVFTMVSSFSLVWVGLIQRRGKLTPR